MLLTVRAIKALPATSPAELNAAGATFANAVTGLEKSWSSQLVAIEIWNEPDLETYWPTRNFDTTFVPFMAGMCKAFEGSRRRHRASVSASPGRQAPVLPQRWR